MLLLSSVIDFTIGLKMYRHSSAARKKQLLLTSVLSNLGILVGFKYFNFFIDSFVSVSENIGWELDFLHLNILLPVGISFYTFQTMSYTLDIYRGKLKPTSNFVDFALFVSFFPQLVAGPIERASALLPQLGRLLTPSIDQIKQGLTLVIYGLFRKIMIGDTIGRIVDQVFGNLEYYKSGEIIAALMLFSIQIYADFSGYSHIARGTSKLLGVELMRNFEQPYFSRSITEFWRRWHISLSSWLKDYLYISLGGNRNGRISMYSNLMLTMLLGGLWHGASWNFVAWGGLHGLYLAIHKFILGDKSVESTRIACLNYTTVFSIISTYVLVLVTWLFFRSTSWDNTVLFITKLIVWESSEYSALFFLIAFSYLAVIVLFDYFEYKTGDHAFLLQIESIGVKLGLLIGMLIVTLIYMFQAEPQPFIYFQF